MLLTIVLAFSGCVLLFLMIWEATVTMPFAALARNFPETEGCEGWKQFGYNRKQQIRQCIIIPICCLLSALVFAC